MKMLLILGLFAGGLLFHSGVLSAQTTQNSQITEVMDSVTSVFQADEEIVKKHDLALDTFFSDLTDCPYSNSILHKLQSTLGRSTCDELIDRALEDKLSYFLIKKGIEASSLKQERKQAIRNSLQTAKDDKCQKAETLSYDSVTSIENAFWECDANDDDCSQSDSSYIIHSLCKEKPNELEEKELIDFLSSELQSCPLEELESFSCQALIEETRNAGLSFYQVRHAVQKIQKETEEKQTESTVATQKEKRQTKKP